jgi:hypothetical protein
VGDGLLKPTMAQCHEPLIAHGEGSYGGAQALAYRPAAAFSEAARSVRSQVKSGSSRPKWP